ncbi:zinc-binding dehydrogenase [Clostridium sp. AM58-1XD]|uniref:zinc-dependent alcohol dehydrogenase n=1 Tax=Clostridium sp. AM58-1XD TaxID=2292307 RepID=UPI000E5034EA|nr:zinc-binding dehydrogenase [Clostridium sp. AM58-1XD]RGY99306.1 hypothetical protein DXA13_08825 [Clostridium sp. AM58-1XD]
MKAVVKIKEGAGNVQVMDVAKPVTNRDEVLIQVKGAGICGTDLHILNDNSYPIHPPVTLGHELSGVITEIGEDVRGWNIGDRVVSETYYYTCGHCFFCKTGKKNLCEDRLSIGSGVNGAMAEFVKVPAANLHSIPEGLSFEEACMTEPLVCCVQAVFDHAVLQPEDYVVLTGPGTIGLFTLQAIKLFGCKVIVLGTRKDEDRLKLALELGADKVMHVEEPDIVDQVKAYCNGRGADAVFECSGAGSAITLCMDLMRKGAHYTQVGIPSKSTAIDMGKVVLREYVIEGTYATKPVWWDKTIKLLEEGKIRLKPLLSSACGLDDWEKGFKKAAAGEGFKHILCPSAQEG